MAAKLQGIFTPTLVPLDERGEINEPELRRFLAFLIGHGVHGLYPNGSTGEFTRLTAEPWRRLSSPFIERGNSLFGGADDRLASSARFARRQATEGDGLPHGESITYG